MHRIPSGPNSTSEGRTERPSTATFQLLSLNPLSVVLHCSIAFGCIHDRSGPPHIPPDGPSSLSRHWWATSQAHPVLLRTMPTTTLGVLGIMSEKSKKVSLHIHRRSQHHANSGLPCSVDGHGASRPFSHFLIGIRGGKHLSSNVTPRAPSNVRAVQLEAQRRESSEWKR